MPSKRSLAPAFAAIALTMLAAAACDVRESGALCDDDVDNDGDGKFDCADTDCILAPECQPCGDGDVGDAEACDDGNLADGDGCSSRCLIEGCGNGTREEGEDCDDGNLAPADGCDFRCRVSRCGDGDRSFQLGEECDDGNILSGDGCSAQCQFERSGANCGNFSFDEGEQCDDGNRVDGDGCSSDCTQEFCGDGIHQPRLGEQCDGNDVPDLPNGDPQECELCSIVRCGNDAVEPEFGEDCDDGNRADRDGCSQFCRTERCGDFQILPPETCDDGNFVDGDGCNSECRSELCGDGILQRRLGELCDDDSADCVGCVATRACVDGGAAGEVCFALQRTNPQLFPSSVALLDGSPNDAGPNSGDVAVMGSLTSSGVFVIDLVGGSFGTSQLVFDELFSIIGVRSADLDPVDLPEPQDELIVFSNDFATGTFDLDTTSYTRRITFNDRVLDAGAAAVAGDDGLDLIASSRTGEVAVSFANGSVSSIQLSELCGRVVGAPVRNGRGVIAACGDKVIAVVGKTPNGASSFLVIDGTREIGAEIRDIAAGDLDGDGVDELVVLTIAPDELRVIALNGNGLAADAPIDLLAATPGADAAILEDLDNDGLDDVIVTSKRATMAVHFAANDFAPSSLPVILSATRAAAGDIDDDGDLDLLVGGGFFQTEALLYVRE